MHAARRFSLLGVGLLLIGGMQPATAAGNDLFVQTIGFEELAAPDNARPADDLPPPPAMPPIEPPPLETPPIEPPSLDWSADKPPSEAADVPAADVPPADVPPAEDASQAADDVLESYELPREDAAGEGMPPTGRPWAEPAVVPSHRHLESRESSAWWDLRPSASALAADRYGLARFGFGSSATLSPRWGGSADPCCRAPKIKYWNHPLLASEHCGCHGSEQQTFVLPIQTDCCTVEVPVCLPCDCHAAPDCEPHRDLLGRMTYDFCWPCGQRVKIVDRHTGTLVVHTFQDE